MLNRQHKPKLAAYSLLEMVVTMTILGLVIVMLSNVLVNSIIISKRSSARSFVREEVAGIMSRISDDFKKATYIGSCSGSMESASCETSNVRKMTWTMCDIAGSNPPRKSICKLDDQGNVLYSSSPSLQVTQFSFVETLSTGASISQAYVLVTVVGDHINTTFNVKNVIQQVSLSTRNYYLL